MTWRWPWRRKDPEQKNGAAAAAKQKAERSLAEQRRRWPEVIHARDELARLAEQAMRRPL
jgi:hypothetical protein